MDNPTCPKCEGESTFLGQLGSFFHFRCIACGWTFHVHNEETV